MSLFRKLLRNAAANPAVRKPALGVLKRANGLFGEAGSARHEQLAAKYKDFTRIPAANFTANQAVAERFATLRGSVVECGVWRGGMMAGMAELLGPDREYHLFDSFEGLPEAGAIDGEEARIWQESGDVDNCRAEEHFAVEAMQMAGVAKAQIHKGWFEHTLKDFVPSQPIAILRLDADWYSSTAECLNFLYPQVAEGGLILIDDYFAWTGCSRAIHDYLSANGSAERIQSENSRLAYIVRRDMSECVAIDPHRKL